MADNLLASKQARDSYIDILKGISILLVLLVHFNQKWTAPIGLISKLSAVGARAPQFFFLISAFLTWKSIDKHGMDRRRFYIGRARRIIPLYYIALVVAMLIPTITINEYSILNIVGHFLLIHGFNPYWINTIMGVGWYVGDLAIFYLICPLLYRIINDLKSSVLCLMICTATSSLSLILWNNTNTDSTLEMFFNTFFFLHQLPILCLGIVIYYIIKLIEDRKASTKMILFLVTGITFLFSAVFIILHLNKRIFTSSFAAGVLCTWLFLICYSIRELFQNKSFNPLIEIGKHSYGVYLFHYTIISCLVLLPHNEGNFLLWTVFFFLSVCISIFVSLLLEHANNVLIRGMGKPWCLSP